MSRLPHIVAPEDFGYWAAMDMVTFEVEIPRGTGKQRVTVAIPRAMLVDLGLHVDCKGGPTAVPKAIERWRGNRSAQGPGIVIASGRKR